MSELVQRLREFHIATDPAHPLHPKICDEAADEIERLQAYEECAMLIIKQREGVIERLKKLTLASYHLLMGSNSIYDPRRDTGPTHWLVTRDSLITELRKAVRDE